MKGNNSLNSNGKTSSTATSSQTGSKLSTSQSTLTSRTTSKNNGTTSSVSSESEYQSTVETSERPITVISDNQAIRERGINEPNVVVRYETSSAENSTSAKQTNARDTSAYSTSNLRMGPPSQLAASMEKAHKTQGPEPVHQAKQIQIKSCNLMELRYPLLLRVNPCRSAEFLQLKGMRLSSPIVTVQNWRIYRKQSAQYRLVPALETRLQCTGTLPSNRVHRAGIQFILAAPEQNVTVIVQPPKQGVKTGCIPRRTDRPQLLLPPEGPRKAEPLHPLWDTVTYTVAQGKHVAVDYSIPTVPTRKVRYYKARMGKIVEVDSATLYRKTEPQPVVVWQAAKAHPLQLSTVEQGDPMLVQRVQLEQNPIYRRQRHQQWEHVNSGTSEAEAMASNISIAYPNIAPEKMKCVQQLQQYEDTTLIRHWESSVPLDRQATSRKQKKQK